MGYVEYEIIYHQLWQFTLFEVVTIFSTFKFNVHSVVCVVGLSVNTFFIFHIFKIQQCEQLPCFVNRCLPFAHSWILNIILNIITFCDCFFWGIFLSRLVETTTRDFGWVVTFSFLIHFWRFLVHQMCQKDALKFHWDIRNNKALPVPRPPLRDSACPECLSVHSQTVLPYSNNKFKENLQNLQILSPLPQVSVNNKSKKKRKNTTQHACMHHSSLLSCGC